MKYKVLFMAFCALCGANQLLAVRKKALCTIVDQHGMIDDWQKALTNPCLQKRTTWYPSCKPPVVRQAEEGRDFVSLSDKTVTCLNSAYLNRVILGCAAKQFPFKESACFAVRKQIMAPECASASAVRHLVALKKLKTNTERNAYVAAQQWSWQQVLALVAAHDCLLCDDAAFMDWLCSAVAARLCACANSLSADELVIVNAYLPLLAPAITRCYEQLRILNQRLVRMLPVEHAHFISWSPDGKFLISDSRGPEYSEPEDQPVTQSAFSPVIMTLWHVASGRCVKQFSDYTIGGGVIFNWSPTSQLLAVHSSEDTQIIDPNTGDVVLSLAWTSMLIWSHDGQKICAGGHDQTVKIINARTGDVMHEFDGINDAIWLPGDTVLALISTDDGTIKLVDSTDYQELKTLQHEGAHSLYWSYDNAFFATVASYPRCTVKLWTMAGDFITEIQQTEVPVVKWSPSGNQVIIDSYTGCDFGDVEKKIYICDAGTAEVKQLCDDNELSNVVWSPDGTRLLAISQSKVTRLLDATTQACLATFKVGLPCAGCCCAFVPHGLWINTGISEQLWDYHTGTLIKEDSRPHPNISPNGMYYAITTPEGVALYQSTLPPCLGVTSDTLPEILGAARAIQKRDEILAILGRKR